MTDLVSMRELSRRAGVTLRAIQLAVMSGRITPTKTEKHGTRTRVFFDPAVSVPQFHNSRDESKKSNATRAEAGKGPQPNYKNKGDKKKDATPKAPTPKAPIPKAPAATPPGPMDPKNLNLFSAGDGAPVPAAHSQQAADGRATAMLNPATTKLHKHRATREEYNAKMAELKYKAESKEFVEAGPVRLLFFEIGQRVQSNMLAIPGRISAIVAAQKNEKKIYDLLNTEITQALESLSNAQLEEIFK